MKPVLLLNLSFQHKGVGENLEKIPTKIATQNEVAQRNQYSGGNCRPSFSASETMKERRRQNNKIKG